MAPIHEFQISELLTRARSGDGDALERLFEKYRPQLCQIAERGLDRRLRSKIDPSDIVQQTLLEAHRAFSGFVGNDEKEWLAWLRQILQNNTNDTARHYKATDKRRLDREVSLSPADSSRSPFDPADSTESPSQAMMREERFDEIEQAMNTLSSEYQQVIRLRHIRHLPFDEVAAQMNRSRPATQMLWVRAIRKLQEILA